MADLFYHYMYQSSKQCRQNTSEEHNKPSIDKL